MDPLWGGGGCSLHFGSLLVFTLKSLSFPTVSLIFWDKEQGRAPYLSIHDPHQQRHDQA